MNIWKCAMKSKTGKTWTFLLSAAAVFLFSCASEPPKSPGPTFPLDNRFSLPATILKVDGPMLTLEVEKPHLSTEDAKLAIKLAQGIIESSYFLEGKSTTLGPHTVEIVRISGNRLLVRIKDKEHALVMGETHDIYLQKKIIAIKDFEVIRGTGKDLGKYVQEDVTTILASSGHFSVVERTKLKTVLTELQLAQAGIMHSTHIKDVGRLLGADLILTGTLAAIAEEWNVNLRLIDTETALIVAALNMAGPLHELKTEPFREIQNISGSFDGENDATEWLMGKIINQRAGKGGFQNVYVDAGQGAEGTKKSLAMDFKLGKQRTQKNRHKPLQATMRNTVKRDLSNYSGISFTMKGSFDLTVTFMLIDGEKNSTNRENWLKNFTVTQDWQKINIPFNSLAVQKGKAEMLHTNHILDLDRIEMIFWIISEKTAKRGTKATLWLDEVSLY